jgi:hypothetical protein
MHEQKKLAYIKEKRAKKKCKNNGSQEEQLPFSSMELIIPLLNSVPYVNEHMRMSITK